MHGIRLVLAWEKLACLKLTKNLPYLDTTSVFGYWSYQWVTGVTAWQIAKKKKASGTIQIATTGVYAGFFKKGFHLHVAIYIILSVHTLRARNSFDYC